MEVPIEASRGKGNGEGVSPPSRLGGPGERRNLPLWGPTVRALSRPKMGLGAF